MKKLLVLASTAVTVVALTASTASAETAEIQGAKASVDWTKGSVTNVSVTMDLCGSDGAPTCKWTGLAGVMPAANGSCPPDWYEDGDAAELKMFWAAPPQTANGTVSSGPREFTLNGAHGQRVCAYLDRTFTLTNFETSWDLVNALLQVDVPVEPDPDPDPLPTMTVAEATILAKGKLAKKYGKSWKKGTSKKVTCKELTTTFNCKASWKFKQKKKSGSVAVAKP